MTCDAAPSSFPSPFRWTKGFSTTGVEGEDVVLLLQRALELRNVHVTVAALANDTVGTLMACR